MLTIGLETPHGPNEWAPHLCLASNLYCSAQFLASVQYSGFNPRTQQCTVYSAQARVCQQCGRRQRGRPELSWPANRLEPYSPNQCNAKQCCSLTGGNLPPTILPTDQPCTSSHCSGESSVTQWQPTPNYSQPFIGKLETTRQASFSGPSNEPLLTHYILLLWP